MPKEPGFKLKMAHGERWNLRDGSLVTVLEKAGSGDAYRVLTSDALIKIVYASQFQSKADA